MLVISMLVIGGLGSLKGAVFGAFLLVLLPEPIRFLPLPAESTGALRQMILSALVILVFLVRPTRFANDLR